MGQAASWAPDSLKREGSYPQRAGSGLKGARGWLTFQGQAGISWESQAENIFIRKDLRDGSILLCYRTCQLDALDKLLNLSELVSSIDCNMERTLVFT